jgi:hypothetical protein
LSIKSVQNVERTRVGVANLLKVAVLPQLVPVSHLDIRKSLLRIVRQRIQEQRFVRCIDVCASPISPVAIAEKHKPACIVEFDPLCLLARLRKAVSYRGLPPIREPGRLWVWPSFESQFLAGNAHWSRPCPLR